MKLLRRLEDVFAPDAVAAWCLLALVYLLLRGPRGSEGHAVRALVLMLDVAVAAAVWLASVVVVMSMVRQGTSRAAPGAWLVLFAGTRLVLVVVISWFSHVASAIPFHVWYAAVSSILLLVPFYLGHLTQTWRQRFTLLVALQLAPLVLRILAAAGALGRDVVDGYLVRLLGLPDLVGVAILLVGSQQLADRRDPLHRRGLGLFAIHAAVSTVLMLVWPSSGFAG